MTLRELLDAADHEVWFDIQPPMTYGVKRPLHVWSADYIGGDDKTLCLLGGILDNDIDYVDAVVQESPEGEAVPMIRVPVLG